MSMRVFASLLLAGIASALPVVTDDRGYGQLDISAMGQKIAMTYAGFDHVITYNFETKRFNAFDMRRSLGVNDTCDYLVFPPLINNVEHRDVFTTMSELSGTRDMMHMTFLGKEQWMMQNTGTGEYEVMRCSGFMPQQKELPCEVYNVGCNAKQMKGNARFFYAGVSDRVIRYDPDDGTMDILSYDSDIPGGAYPFKEAMSAHFSPFTGEVEFAAVMLPDGKELLMALKLSTGEFKVWDYNSRANNIESLIQTLMVSGSLEMGYRVKHVGENSLLIYQENTGEFEVLQLDVVDGNVTITSQKRDSLFYGHPCILHTRGACVSSPGCAWCTDSATCHHLNSVRQSCSGEQCSEWVDEYSPKHLKFSEMENPTIIKDFGDEDPSSSPVSPMRGASSANSAVPITAGPHDEVELEDGLKMNPELGMVFTPPLGNPEHKMDDRFVPFNQQKFPEVEASEYKMNNAVAARKVHIRSPIGDAGLQETPTDDALEPPPQGTTNVTLISPCDRAPAKSMLKTEKFEPPVVDPPEPLPKFNPAEEGTQGGEDMMNLILSKFSSLAPKSMNVKADRDFEETARVPKSSKDYLNKAFNPPQPTQITQKPPKQTEDPVVPVKLEAYTDGQMESGILEQDRSGPVHSQQGFAMANAQFKSESIYRPWVPNPEVTTLEHKGELTGRNSVTVYDHQLLDEFLAANRSDAGTVVEGTDFEDKSVDTVAGKKTEDANDDGNGVNEDEVINGCCVYPVGDTSKVKGATYTFVDGAASGCTKPGSFRPSMTCKHVKAKFYATPTADIPIPT